MILRTTIVLALLGAFAIAPTLHRGRRRRLEQGPAIHPAVPPALLDGADRTWVLFTTPWCASCGPVEEQLRASDPAARFVRIDATRDPDLAGAFSVRSAPTALLADREGQVQARLVGVDAVSRYLDETP